jgi:endonuclease YncB( thermonuclease family)
VALGNHALADEQARIIEGSAQVIDGDTLEVEGELVRLLDIDAPALAQTCAATTEELRRCGEAAANALSARIGSSPVTCNWASRDNYGRILARCFILNEDLSAWSVRAGWSFAFLRYSTRLVEEERAARRERLGI